MDPAVIEELASAGFRVDEDRLPRVAIALDEDDEPVPPGETVAVEIEGGVIDLRLESIPELFAGTRCPTDFGNEPPEDYVPFLASIELTAALYCVATERSPRDGDFESLYRLLRKRPASTHPDPLFSYLQAAARLYMSVRDVSRGEFEVAIARLARSASRFGNGPGSTNYLDYALLPFFEELQLR